MVNLIPLNDEKEHTESTDCACDPRVEWQDPDTGEIYVNGPMIIHNAFDCREVFENLTNSHDPEKPWMIIAD